MYRHITNAPNLIIAPNLGRMQISIFFHRLQFHYHAGETGHLLTSTDAFAVKRGSQLYWEDLAWRCWRIFLLLMFISGRLTAAASEIPSNSPVIICCGVSKEVSALLLMLALTLTISTFFCVWGGVYCHLLPIKMHYSCLTLLLPYIDLFFLARILMTLLRLLGPFDTHTCTRFE